jgi:hypothetical protein
LSSAARLRVKLFSEIHSGHANNDSGAGGIFHPFPAGIVIHIVPESLFTSLRNRYSHAPEYAIGSILLGIGTTHEKSLPIARCRFPCLGFIPAVNLLMQWESRRQSCLKIDLFSGDGVVEFQILGVQEISSIAGEAGEIFKRLAG